MCIRDSFCGVGCPVNGKQAMHLTYIPDALGHGARFYSDVQVDEVSHTGRRATGVTGRVLVRDTGRATAHRVTVSARCVVSAGGALHSPALLLRSGLDRGGLVGQRTMIHPVTGLSGEYAEAIRPWMGAPQSAACHEFVDRGPEHIGFFIETPPMQPCLLYTSPSPRDATLSRMPSSA